MGDLLQFPRLYQPTRADLFHRMVIQQAVALLRKSSTMGSSHIERLHAFNLIKDLYEQAADDESATVGTSQEGKIRVIRGKVKKDGGTPPPIRA